MPLEAVTAALTPLVHEPVPFDCALDYLDASIHENNASRPAILRRLRVPGTALSRKLPAMTTERNAWDKVDVGVRIIKIR